MTNVTIRLDSDDKIEFSRICEKIGLSVSTVFNRKGKSGGELFWVKNITCRGQ